MTEEEYKKKLEHFETRVKRLQMYNEMLTIENQKLREENKELKGLPMYENDSRTGTDYEYNHGLDEYMQQRYKKPKIFMPISSYSKERKAFLIDWIERITWDASCNPERFLELLKNDGYGKQWALTKMIEFLPYRVVRMILTKEFLKENVNEEIISQIFPLQKQEAVKRWYNRLTA